MTSFLVVLRAGDGSLHPNWLAGSRNWDLAISYYGIDKQKVFPEAMYQHRFRGGKWDGLGDFFSSHPDVIERYDYFWLPDDDILTDAGSINKLFELMKQYDLELGQPSLTANSYFSYLVTLQCPCFSIRYTTLVEIMAPILARSLLVKVLPYFETTQSGFGLDFMWHRLTSDPARKAAILDHVSVVHTRPVSGAAAEQLGHQRVSRWKEKEEFLAQWGVHQHHAVVFAGRTANGLALHSQAICAFIQFICWSWECWRFKWGGSRRFSSIRKYGWFLRVCVDLFLCKPEIAVLEQASVSRTCSRNGSRGQAK